MALQLHERNNEKQTDDFKCGFLVGTLTRKRRRKKLFLAKGHLASPLLFFCISILVEIYCSPCHNIRTQRLASSWEVLICFFHMVGTLFLFWPSQFFRGYALTRVSPNLVTFLLHSLLVFDCFFNTFPPIHVTHTFL